MGTFFFGIKKTLHSYYKRNNNANMTLYARANNFDARFGEVIHNLQYEDQ
jgi:hypothetical protein